MSPVSPVSPAVVAPASLSGVAGLLGIPSGFVDIIDFNGSATRLPPLTGPDRVGVHHFTVKHDLGFRFSAPSACSNANTSLPQLQERYGEDGVSYFNETCGGIRHIPVSVFYPACESPQEPQPKTASVFTQSLLEIITAQVFGHTDSMRNMDSQAFLDAPTCPDKYPMVILSPPVGGQRQAYTQLASDIASYHHIVVTVDHAFQSGAIESEDGNTLFNLAGELIKPREANSGRVVDLMAVALHFNDSSNLAPLLWTPGTEVDLLNTFVFGHGQGGLIARMMVASNLLSAGGTLDSLIRMPAPYNESNVLYQHSNNQTSTKKPTQRPQPTSQPNPGAGDELRDITGELGESLGERLKNMARGLRKTMMDSLSSLICRVLGTCGTLVQKRELTSTSYDHKWDNHAYKPCDDSCNNCRFECKPDDPRRLFPGDLGQSAGKLRPDYQDSIGNYKSFSGRNTDGQHDMSCYNDDYCYYRCCSNKDVREGDNDWEDGYENYRQYHEDHEDDWDRQDNGRVPDKWWNEDDAPPRGQHGAENSPGLDDGVEDSSGKEEVQSPNDGDESGGDEDGSADDQDNSEDDGDDSRDDEEDSPNDEDDSTEDDEDNDKKSPGAEDGSREDDEDTEDEL